MSTAGRAPAWLPRRADGDRACADQSHGLCRSRGRTRRARGVPASSAARIVGDHSMSRPVDSRRFHRSTTASASSRAARSALNSAAPALMSSARVLTPTAPVSPRERRKSIRPSSRSARLGQITVYGTDPRCGNRRADRAIHRPRFEPPIPPAPGFPSAEPGPQAHRRWRDETTARAAAFASCCALASSASQAEPARQQPEFAVIGLPMTGASTIAATLTYRAVAGAAREGRARPRALTNIRGVDSP
jgi:hypothetical protein